MTFRTEWLPEHDDALRQGRANGLSYGEIAKDLNKRFRVSFTRNACIGRAARLCVVPAPTAITKLANQKKRRIARQRKKKPLPVTDLAGSNAVKLPETVRIPNPLGSELARQRCEVDMPLLRCVDVDPLHIDILDLNKHTCRWPLGGWPEAAPVTFCGLMPEQGSSYCPAHHRLGLRTSAPSASPAKENA